MGNDWSGSGGGGGAALTEHSVLATTGNGHGSTNTKIRRFSVNTVTGTYIAYAESAANGASFTIQTGGAGLYFISYTDGHSGLGFLGISRNSNQLATSVHSITAAHCLAMTATLSGDVGGISTMRWLSAGDVIRAHTTGVNDSTNAQTVQFYIVKVA